MCTSFERVHIVRIFGKNCHSCFERTKVGQNSYKLPAWILSPIHIITCMLVQCARFQAKANNSFWTMSLRLIFSQFSQLLHTIEDKGKKGGQQRKIISCTRQNECVTCRMLCNRLMFALSTRSPYRFYATFLCLSSACLVCGAHVFIGEKCQSSSIIWHFYYFVFLSNLPQVDGPDCVSHPSSSRNLSISWCFLPLQFSKNFQAE